MILRSARGRLGFPYFKFAGVPPNQVGQDDVGLLPRSAAAFFAVPVGLVLFLTGARLVAYEIILGALMLWIVVELMIA